MWGKKKVPEQSGFMGDMSEGQDKALEEFRSFIKENQITDHPQYDDYYLLRFLRARKFDMDKTKLMFHNFIEWRKVNDVDNVIETYHFDEMSHVQEVYPHNYHQIDKKGRPIYIERQGMLAIDELFKITTEERLVKHYIQSYELLLKLRFPSCSAIAGQRIEQGLTILDLTGGTMKIMSKKVYALIQLASKIGQDYYPEIMGQCFIVNSPFIFTGIWAIVKGFLDEKTRNKISIKGGNFQKELLELVEPQNLPDFLGGTCKCEEYGGCMKSGVGPWNDFEITYPVGIKKRQIEPQAEHKHDQEEEKNQE